MIDINKIKDAGKFKLDKIPFEDLDEFLFTWGPVCQNSSNLANKLKYATTEKEKIKLKIQCDNLILLYPRVKKEQLKRKGKLKSICSLIKIDTGLYDRKGRIDPFTERSFSPEFIKRYTISNRWLKDRFQKPLFKCETCNKRFDNVKGREKHEEEAKHKTKQIHSPTLAEHPHYICPNCRTLLPSFIVKGDIKEELIEDNSDKISFCCDKCTACIEIDKKEFLKRKRQFKTTQEMPVYFNCNVETKDEKIYAGKLQYEDPYYSEQIERTCLKCLNGYKLSKTRWYAQGLLCPACKEKEETRQKNLKKKKNTP